MKVLFGGDFMVRGRVERALAAGKMDMLADFGVLTTEYDLVVVNLEGPITDSREPIHKTGPAIKMPAQTAQFLKSSGVSLVTLANNHILDYGSLGLKDTLESVAASGIFHVGAGMTEEEFVAPFRFEKVDGALTVLNFAENEWSTGDCDFPGAAPLSLVRNYQAISRARVNSDFVAVVVHGGHENYHLPSPRMKETYRFFVDAGADVVINHHQHCVSGYEVYCGKPIFYGVGNVLLDHGIRGGGDWTKGILVSLDLSPGQGISFEILHFDQCTDESFFSLCSEAETEKRNLILSRYRSVIDNDKELARHFREFAESKAKQYMAYVEPVPSRYYRALVNRGWLPSLLSKKRRLYLENVIRCESHREVLLRVLGK